MNQKVISILVIVVILISGCGRRAQKDYIEFWCASNSFEIEFSKEIVEIWNSDSTHRQVRLQPVPEGQSSEEVMLAAIVGKTTPDIYSNVWPGVVEQYREAGVIYNFNQFSDFTEFLSNRLPENLNKQFISSDGQFYQFPWKGNPLLLAYNVRILKDNLDCSPPKTHDDLNEIGEKLLQWNEENDSPPLWLMDPNISPIWWQRLFDFYPFYVSATQGNTYISEAREVLLDSKDSRIVFDLFRRNYNNGLLPISMFKEDIFLMERLVFHLTGPWSIAQYQKFSQPGFRWDYTSIPVPSEGMLPYTYGDAKNIVIFSDTEYPEECWEFVKFLCSKKNDLLFMEITQQLPLRKHLLSDVTFTDFFEQNPQMVIFAEHIPYIVGLDRSLYLQEIFDMISKAWDAIVIYRAKELEQGLVDLNTQVQLQINRELK